MHFSNGYVFILGGITHVIVRTLVIYVFDVLVHGGGGSYRRFTVRKHHLRKSYIPPKKLQQRKKQSSVHF